MNVKLICNLSTKQNINLSLSEYLNKFIIPLGAIEEGEIAKELWDNFPALRDNFNILSKVGEGKENVL